MRVVPAKVMVIVIVMVMVMFVRGVGGKERSDFRRL
jgi:hypothetical protein